CSTRPGPKSGPRSRGMRMQRRDMVIGLGAAAVAGTARAQTPAPIVYDYFFVRTQPGQRAAFMAFVNRTLRGLTGAAGGDIIGLFTPQLGWDSNEVAILIRWRPGVGDPSAISLALLHAPGSGSFDRHPLIATARAGREQKLDP